MSIATLLARAARAARVSKRLEALLHMVKATPELRSANAARVFTREHLFCSIFNATFPARRQSSRFILPLWLHWIHLLWMSTSPAWHFFRAFCSHSLLSPWALVQRTFLILRSPVSLASLYSRMSLAFICT